MTKNAATSHTLNMEEEKFVFNDELVINVVVTIQAQYTSIKQKPLVEKVSPLKSVSGSESSSDPILPPPAVKEYKKPLPNSKTSCEDRSDQVSCDMLAEGDHLHSLTKRWKMTYQWEKARSHLSKNHRRKMTFRWAKVISHLSKNKRRK